MEQTVTFESNAMFSVPTRIVDYHLKAPDVELRLILFLMRHANSSFTKDDLIRAIGEDEARLDRAFEYWCAAGVLFKTGQRYIAERPTLKASDIAPYTADQIAARVEADPQLRFLFSSAEEALAKPLTPADASTIFSLVEWNGLPAEVAAMLVRYCTSQGKSLAKIQKTGIEWAEKGITTYEAAEEYIREMNERAQIENRVAAMFGLTHRALTDAERRAFIRWKKEFDFSDDVIRLAYERAIASSGKYSYNYIDKILTRWHEAGYTTVREIEACDEKPADKTRRPARKRHDSAIDQKDLSDSVDNSWAIIEDTLKPDDEE